MKIYVASFFNTRERLRPYVTQLRGMGHIVTSEWLNEELKPGKKVEETATHLYTSEELRGFAIRDVGNLFNSTGIIVDTFDVTPRGGREVEYGAFVFGPVPLGYIVGPKRNVFHELATQVFPTWEICLDYFLSIAPLRYVHV